MTLLGALDVDVTGTAVEFTFTATNVDDDPIELTFPSGKVADVIVHEDDTPIWRWSDDRMFTQAIQERRLAPGETITHTAVWDDPEPGRYVAEAVLDARDEQLAVRTEFRA